MNTKPAGASSQISNSRISNLKSAIRPNLARPRKPCSANTGASRPAGRTTVARGRRVREANPWYPAPSNLTARRADESQPRRVKEIQARYLRSPDEAIQFAQATLVELVAGRPLLVICEKLIDLFEAIGSAGQQRWRAFIQEQPFWTILATTPAMFSGVQLQQSPFYGCFTIRYLRQLNFETAVTLLSRKAMHEGKHALAHSLATPTGRARVRAIHHLAGGNHRVYVILFDFLDKGSLEELVTPFMRMVDDLTPYYQD